MTSMSGAGVYRLHIVTYTAPSRCVTPPDGHPGVWLWLVISHMIDRACLQRVTYPQYIPDSVSHVTGSHHIIIGDYAKILKDEHFSYSRTWTLAGLEQPIWAVCPIRVHSMTQDGPVGSCSGLVARGGTRWGASCFHALHEVDHRVKRSRSCCTCRAVHCDGSHIKTLVSTSLCRCSHYSAMKLAGTCMHMLAPWIWRLWHAQVAP